MEENLPFQSFNYEEVQFSTLLTKKFTNRKPYLPADLRKVTAFIPGTIVKVFAKENHKVKKGDALLSLQAMKMNNILLAPKNSTVRKIHVKQGDTVIKNQLLVELK